MKATDLYRIKYVYVSPGPGGPSRGSVAQVDPMAKGEIFYAMFGRARVVSCGKIRNPSERDRQVSP